MVLDALCDNSEAGEDDRLERKDIAVSLDRLDAPAAVIADLATPRYFDRCVEPGLPATNTGSPSLGGAVLHAR